MSSIELNIVTRPEDPFLCCFLMIALVRILLCFLWCLFCLWGVQMGFGIDFCNWFVGITFRRADLLITYVYAEVLIMLIYGYGQNSVAHVRKRDLGVIR